MSWLGTGGRHDCLTKQGLDVGTLNVNTNVRSVTEIPSETQPACPVIEHDVIANFGKISLNFLFLHRIRILAVFQS